MLSSASDLEKSYHGPTVIQAHFSVFVKKIRAVTAQEVPIRLTGKKFFFYKHDGRSDFHAAALSQQQKTW
jgi:hypothetical protein